MLTRTDINDREPLRLSEPAGDEAQWSLGTLLWIPWWHRGTVALTLLAALAAALLYVSTAPSLYTATADVVLETKVAPPSPIDQRGDSQVDMAVVESQVEALGSSRVVLAAVRKLRLADNPEFNDEDGGLIAWLLTAFDGAETEPELSLLDRELIALGRVRSGLKIERLGRSYVASVSFTSLSPKTAADVANGIVAAYIAEQIEGSLETAQRGNAWMERRVRELQEETLAAARAVEAFKSSEGLVIDGQGTLASETELRELVTALANARATTAQAQARLERVMAVLENNGGAAKSYEVEVEVARASEEGLTRRIDEVFNRTSQSRAKLVQLRNLETNAHAKKAIHDAFLSQYTRAIQQQSFPVTEARALSAATPPVGPSKPRVPVILFLALVTGAGAGLALAYAREWHARPARSGEQIERELGIHTLGSVPRRSFGGVRSRPIQLVANACDSAQDIRRTTEALRAVRFGVDERCEVTIGCIVAIVSPNHGEGRSTIAFNLACVIAASGRSCLLLDADFRSSAPLFQSGRSLLQAVDGKIPLSKAVARQAAGFDYLGPETPQKLHDPTTCLGGTGMKTLLATARCEYDYVIVDTPAMLAQTDARVIAAFADSIVVVAEWGRTSLNDLRRALRISDAVSSRVTGVVINKAPLGGH